MDIRLLDPTEYESSKALWDECFSDGEYFVNWYYEERSRPEYVLGGFSGGRLVSMLHMIPMRMRFAGGVKRVCMVSGVCTKPEYRGRGLCSSLFERAFPIMAERGFDATVLQPFDTAFYERFGYRTYIRRQVVTLTREQIPKEHGRGSGQEPPPSALAALYSAFTGPFKGASLRDEEYFRGFIREYSAKDARLEFTGKACLAGYADGEVFRATELFFTGEPDIFGLMPEGFESWELPLPLGIKTGFGSVRTEDFSMIRSIRPDFDPGEGEMYGFDRY